MTRHVWWLAGLVVASVWTTWLAGWMPYRTAVLLLLGMACAELSVVAVNTDLSHQEDTMARLDTCPDCTHYRGNHGPGGCTVIRDGTACWCGRTDEESDAFDGPRAQAERERGQAAAMEADRVQEWKARANAELERLAAAGRVFTADHLIGAVGVPDVGANRNNVIGAVFGAASRRRLIEKTGRTVASARVATHGHMINEWRGR